MWLFDILFSLFLQLCYFEVRISRSVSESPLEFEIKSVDCSSKELWLKIPPDVNGFKSFSWYLAKIPWKTIKIPIISQHLKHNIHIFADFDTHSSRFGREGFIHCPCTVGDNKGAHVTVNLWISLTGRSVSCHHIWVKIKTWATCTDGLESFVDQL